MKFLTRVEKPVGIEPANPFNPEDWPPVLTIDFSNPTDRPLKVAINRDDTPYFVIIVNKAEIVADQLCPGRVKIQCDPFALDLRDHARIKFWASAPGASVAIYVTCRDLRHAVQDTRSYP